MNEDLASWLASKLIPLKEQGFISKLAELVKVIEVNVADVNGKTKTKRIPFPVSQIANDNFCTDANDLIPNSKERCIVYFEGYGTSIDKYNIVSAIKLICWYNSKGFQTNDNLASKLIHLISDEIGESGVHSLFGAIDIQIVEIIEADNKIFARYSYDEAESQYLTYPYNCFSITFKLKYRNSGICINQLPNSNNQLSIVDLPNCCN